MIMPTTGHLVISTIGNVYPSHLHYHTKLSGYALADSSPHLSNRPHACSPAIALSLLAHSNSCTTPTAVQAAMTVHAANTALPATATLIAPAGSAATAARAASRAAIAVPAAPAVSPATLHQLRPPY